MLAMDISAIPQDKTYNQYIYKNIIRNNYFTKIDNC